MALISIVLIVVGFLIQIFAGVKLSLTGVVQKETGELDQTKMAVYTLVITVATLMIMAGVLGYYAIRHNLPYYYNFF